MPKLMGDGDIAHEEDFPMTEQERKCSWCNFKKVCFLQGDSVFLGNIK